MEWSKVPIEILIIIKNYNEIYKQYLKTRVLTHDICMNFRRLRGYYDNSYVDITDSPEYWHLYDPSDIHSDIDCICLVFGPKMKILKWCAFCNDIQYSKYLGCCYNSEWQFASLT